MKEESQAAAAEGVTKEEREGARIKSPSSFEAEQSVNVSEESESVMVDAVISMYTAAPFPAYVT